jgi:hypothetical protein
VGSLGLELVPQFLFAKVDSKAGEDGDQNDVEELIYTLPCFLLLAFFVIPYQCNTIK